jgi:MORN repeat
MYTIAKLPYSSMTSLSHNSDKLIATSQRNGARGTVYGIRRKENLANKDVIYNKSVELIDSFTAGSNYKGEWKDDKKHGFGTELYPNGCSYSGQW